MKKIKLTKERFHHRSDDDNPFMKAGKRKLVLFSLLLMIIMITGTSAFSQTFLSISASSGSLAPYGENQGLVINSAGLGEVYRENVETGVVDSAAIALTPSQMQTIVDTAVAYGFSGLGSLYDSGAVDGSGATVHLVTTAFSNTVEVRNICIGAMNHLVRTINVYLLSSGIQLNYGELNDVCP